MNNGSNCNSNFKIRKTMSVVLQIHQQRTTRLDDTNMSSGMRISFTTCCFCFVFLSNFVTMCLIYKTLTFTSTGDISKRGPQTHLTNEAKRMSARTCRAEEPWSSPVRQRCSSPSSTAWFHCGTLTTPAHRCPRYPAHTRKAHAFVEIEHSTAIIILQGLRPSPMPERDGRNIFPRFLWRRWRSSSSRPPPPDPCSAPRRVCLSVTHRRDLWVSKRRNRSIAAPEKKVRGGGGEERLSGEQRDYRKEPSFSAFHPGWCERTPPTECRSRSAGKKVGEKNSAIVGNHKVFAVCT